MEKLKRGVKWKSFEDELIREKYFKIPTEELSKILNRTEYAIQQRSLKLGFKKNTRRFSIVSGQKFNRLTAIELVYIKNSYRYWKFKCECGKESITRANDVVGHRIISCGCFANERYNELYGLPKHEAIKNELYRIYQRNANTRNLIFSLSKENFNNLISQNCYICGIEPKQRPRPNRGCSDFYYNGIDRYDNTIGYTVENSKPCCGTCNWAKGDLDLITFNNWLKRLVKNNYDKTE